MMIEPYAYVAMEIKGKTREVALKKIRHLQNEIKRLTKVIEEDPFSEENMCRPSAGTVLSCYRDYIDAAKYYFKTSGWEYVPSEDEIKDKEFNDRLWHIESIEFSYYGFMCKGNKWRFMFNGEFVKIIRVAFFESDTEVINQEYIENWKKSEIVERLQNLHMSEWKQKYEYPVFVDGIRWTIAIKYIDGTETIFEGNTKHPYNFYGFTQAMNIDELAD